VQLSLCNQELGHRIAPRLAKVLEFQQTGLNAVFPIWDWEFVIKIPN
jgi:hypothetical protein